MPDNNNKRSPQVTTWEAELVISYALLFQAPYYELVCRACSEKFSEIVYVKVH